MRGHEPLKAMRRQGVRPGVIFIDFGDEADGWWRMWPDECPGRAHVEIGENDMVSSLDLRFCVGMQVFVHGDDNRRVMAVANACIASDAASVLAVVTKVEVVKGEPVATIVSQVELRPAQETAE